jgi:hypothetical protein
MNIYSIVKYIHIISDITLFIGVGAQILCLAALRRATRFEQVHSFLGLITISNRVGVGGSLLTIISGVYMAITVWTFQVPWIIVALGSIALIIGPVVGFIVEPRTKVLTKAAQEASEGPLSSTMIDVIQDRMFGVGLQTNLAVVLGIVFLMTIKPDMTTAIITMGTAVILGFASGWLVWRGRGRIARASAG